MIYIIGTGSIGSALAVLLLNAGKEVVLVRGSVNHLPTSLQTLHVALADGSSKVAAVTVKTMDKLEDLHATILVTSKSYGNEHIASQLSAQGFRGKLVLLQNGLNIEQPFLKLGLTRLYRCVLLVTSQFTAEHHIRFRPVAACPIGRVGHADGDLDELIAAINNPWFAFAATADIDTEVWKKVIINCVFNSICPLLETDNGIFFRNPAALHVAQLIISECLVVATKCGISLDQAAIETGLLAISKSSDGQLISTLQDIRAGRQTEIGTLNLEITKTAEIFNLHDAVPATRLLGELIEIKSKLKP